jgi:hypothetical protein
VARRQVGQQAAFVIAPVAFAQIRDDARDMARKGQPRGVAGAVLRAGEQRRRGGPVQRGQPGGGGLSGGGQLRLGPARDAAVA